MAKITKHINWNITFEINNSVINIVYKNWKTLLSKKDIWELFSTQKSKIKDVIIDMNINNDDVFYNKKREKNIKLYSVESIILIWYKLKKFSETKHLIKANRIIKNINNNLTILDFFKSKCIEIKNKFSFVN